MNGSSRTPGALPPLGPVRPFLAAFAFIGVITAGVALFYTAENAAISGIERPRAQGHARAPDAIAPVLDQATAPTPLLKAEMASDSGSPSRGAAPVPSFKTAVMLAEDTFISPFFALDLSPEIAPVTPLPIALGGDVNDGPSEVAVRLSRGETFVDALRRAGVRNEDRNAAAAAFAKHQNMKQLRAGQELVLTTAPPNQTLFQITQSKTEPEAHLLSLEYRPEPEIRIGLNRVGPGAFVAEKHATVLVTKLAVVHGRIDGSLFVSAKRQGAPDKVIADLANMFAYDVDFQREIFGGDEFEAVYELRYDDRGIAVGAGEIIYGRLKWRGRQKEKGYYRFASEQDGRRPDYFDASGQSAKRLLMKTPIDGARLSSGFGTRTHPILGYAKAHRGVDFAAPRGTPVKAAGDGVIERADVYGSFGNYVRIRHADGYQTAYAHLNGFAKGVKAGRRVSQGDIIGYVGTTGRSTGPHLHYEVHHHGKAQNPQNLKVATGVQLSGKELERFRGVRAAIDALRAPDVASASPVVASGEERKSAL